jgi:hypothetical protein
MAGMARVRAHRSLPALVTAAGERASLRFREFFAGNIRNPYTRRAYARAAEEFLGLVRERRGAVDRRRAAGTSMAYHASTRTTQLYDRRREELTPDKIERIAI